MSKQQVSIIKKVLTILLAVLFAVSLSSAAASNANYYTNISMSNGYTTIVSFSDEPAKIFETYTMYPHNNGVDYDQVIRVENGSIYNKTNMDFVQIIHSHGSNVTDIMTINGTKVNPDDPYGDISYQTYGEIARYKEQIDEAKRVADLKNMYEKDIKTQDEALQIDPQNSTAWTIKGLTLYNFNKYDEAIKAYDEAIRINPRNSKAWIYKGLVLRDLGRYDEAIKADEKAIEINPENSTAWTNKGFALYSLNKYDEALAAYDKAIEVNPRNEAAWYFKGDALYKLNKSDKAGKAWDKQNDIRESNLIADRNKAI
jgi:tetratricopeptide (TPR) repeat protein